MALLVEAVMSMHVLGCVISFDLLLLHALLLHITYDET